MICCQLGTKIQCSTRAWTINRDNTPSLSLPMLQTGSATYVTVLGILTGGSPHRADNGVLSFVSLRKFLTIQDRKSVLLTLTRVMVYLIAMLSFGLITNTSRCVMYLIAIRINNLFSQHVSIPEALLD